MKNKKTIMIGIVAAIICSVIFVNALNSIAGIGAGICFGLAFYIVESISFKK